MNWLLGSTTVTPAAALGMWRLDSNTVYRDTTYDSKWKITRDKVTGNFFYSYSSTSSNGESYSDSEPFYFASLPARRNYFCDLSSTDPETGQVIPFRYTILEDFEVHIWVSSLVKTGGFPPGAPYPVWMKSDANKLASSCAAITPFSREVRNSGNLYDSGTITVKFGLLNYEYNWPPLVWCGGAYDY